MPVRALVALIAAVTLASCATVLPTNRGLPDAQGRALTALRAESRIPVQFRFDASRLRYVRLEVPVAPGIELPAEARAMAFLEAHADLYAIDSPRDSLFPVRIVANASGNHVFFDQVVNGIPVYGGQLAVHIAGDRVIATNGNYVNAFPTVLEPRTSAERAAASAVEHAAGGRHRVAGTPRLVYFSPKIFQSPKEIALRHRDDSTRLAWQITVLRAGTDSGWEYLVDAASAAVIARVPTDHTHSPAKDFRIRTANNSGETLFCGFSSPTEWFTAAGPVAGASPDAEGTSAFATTHAAYDLFLSRFHRHSWDDANGKVSLILDDSDRPGNAAFVTVCGHFAFGPDMSAPDVIGHEYTHGVTSKTAGLRYAYQSGALNESYSDVFGSMLDNNWSIGEAAVSGTLRNMANPPSFMATVQQGCGPLPFGTGCIGSWITVAHPDRMSLFLADLWDDESGDWGGVHINSGIPNKGAFLIAQGATHNGITVSGIGRLKTSHLYHEVLTSWLTSSSDFQTAANVTIAATSVAALAGRNGFTSANACSVVNAFAAVELAAADLDCDGTPDTFDQDDDGDGVADGLDNCPRTANPGQTDTDGDGAGDACDDEADNDGVVNASDNCPLTPNPPIAGRQSDRDGDGRGDACDDTDNDGVLDATDNCPYDRNPLQADTDGDGFGDACDKDLDNDGFCQVAGTTFGSDVGVPAGGCGTVSDNCPYVANPDQRDSDNDGYGDACDVCPAHANSGYDQDRDGIDSVCDDDDDGDGVLDTADNCPTVANADQGDWNGNGVGTKCDPTEQINFGRNTVVFDGAVRNRLERFQIIDIPIRPDPFDPFFSCRVASGSREMELAVDIGVPAVAAAVDDRGMYHGMTGPSLNPTVRLTPSGDFCVLPVTARGETSDRTIGRRAYVGNSYRLRIVPLADVKADQRFRVVSKVNDSAPDSWKLPLAPRP